MASKIYITAQQAENISQIAKFASQQAKSVGCMVEVDLESLQLFPTSPQFHAQVELFENEQFSLPSINCSKSSD